MRRSSSSTWWWTTFRARAGPGVTTADLLVVNKTYLAPYVGPTWPCTAADVKGAAR